MKLTSSEIAILNRYAGHVDDKGRRREIDAVSRRSHREFDLDVHARVIIGNNFSCFATFWLPGMSLLLFGPEEVRKDVEAGTLMAGDEEVFQLFQRHIIK